MSKMFCMTFIAGLMTLRAKNSKLINAAFIKITAGNFFLLNPPKKIVFLATFLHFLLTPANLQTGPD